MDTERDVMVTVTEKHIDSIIQNTFELKMVDNAAVSCLQPFSRIIFTRLIAVQLLVFCEMLLNAAVLYLKGNL